MQNMIKRKAVYIPLLLAATGVVGYNIALGPEFRDQPNAVSNCPTAVFDKSAVVYDSMVICGTNGVPVAKLKHAAAVAAEWLDNDGDGEADESGVLQNLKENKATVIMTRDGGSLGGNIKMMLSGAFGYFTIGLTAEETNNPARRDASQEEIHHNIMNAGWMTFLPEVFSDQPQEESDLYKIWKYADDNGHYSYDDPTCDDACKVSEFVYLATAAYLGSDADLFSDELRLKNRDDLKRVVPEVIDIFEAQDYVYPTKYWPKGIYAHPGHIVYSGNVE